MHLKFEDILSWTKNTCKFVKESSYKSLYLNVNRNHMSTVQEHRKAKLKQRVPASLAKYVELFCCGCNQTSNHVLFLRIPKTKHIPNTPSRC